MGQAKLRGTKEERDQIGTQKRLERELAHVKYLKDYPPKPKPKLAMLIALANSFAPAEVLQYECELAKKEREKRNNMLSDMETDNDYN